MFLEHVPILKMSYFWPQIASNPLHHTHCITPIAPERVPSFYFLLHRPNVSTVPLWTTFVFFEFFVRSRYLWIWIISNSLSIIFSPFLSFFMLCPLQSNFYDQLHAILFVFCLKARDFYILSLRPFMTRCCYDNHYSVTVYSIRFTVFCIAFSPLFGSGNCPFYEYLNCLLCSRKCVEDIGEPSFDLYHFSIVACCEWPNCCAYARDALVVCRLTISGNWSMCMLFCWLDLICPHAIGDNAFFVCILFDLL